MEGGLKRRLVFIAVLGACVAALVGQSFLWGWYIEDSAISFAYAQNFAEGWGLVRYPGDERIEGYSNPLWVLLMAGFSMVGVTPFQSSKWLALLLSVVTVPLTYGWAKRGDIGGWAVVAAWLLALDAQFVIWSASGLENSLFCAALAGALYRTDVEAERGGFPFAALFYLGLSLTRPEGVVYAALGGAWMVLLELLGQRRWWRIPAWLAVFWVPFGLYHFARYEYFAYPFPSTYYAKIGDTRFRPLNWSFGGWKYLRSYSLELTRFWYLPVFMAGGSSLRGWRVGVYPLIVVISAILFLIPGVEPLTWLSFWPEKVSVPSWWISLRVAWLATLAVGVPLLAIRSPGWRVRVLAWLTAILGLVFAFRSGGDWMRGYRWLSLIAVPLAVLFAMGVSEWAGLIGRLGHSERWRSTLGPRIGTTIGALLTVGVLIPQVVYQVRYKPETSPFSVNKRVRHYRWAMEKLMIENASIADHDMGAMLYWGRDLGVVRDSKGLIDIAHASHNHDRRFLREYSFEENIFDLAHAHASTAFLKNRVSDLWKERYIEIPGYGKNNFHVGNYVRKALFMRPWDGPIENAVSFENGVKIHGLQLPAAEVGHESFLVIQYGVQSDQVPQKPFRLLLVLESEAGELVRVFDLPLGFEDWYPQTEWATHEVFYGQTALFFAKSIPVGHYKTRLVVLGEQGPSLPSELGERVSRPQTPLFMDGEVVLDFPIEVIPREKMGSLASADVNRAVEFAKNNKCKTAEKLWFRARSRRIKSRDWQVQHRAAPRAAIAACWALRAERSDRAKALDYIQTARRFDITNPEVIRVGKKIAEPWFQDGIEAREADDLERAHRDFVDVMHADPSRSWARRYLEEIRTERLKLRR